MSIVIEIILVLYIRLYKVIIRRFVHKCINRSYGQLDSLFVLQHLFIRILILSTSSFDIVHLNTIYTVYRLKLSVMEVFRFNISGISSTLNISSLRPL